MNTIEEQVQEFWKLSRAWRRGIDAAGMTYGGTIGALTELKWSRSHSLVACCCDLVDDIVVDRVERPLEVEGQLLLFPIREFPKKVGQEIESVGLHAHG